MKKFFKIVGAVFIAFIGLVIFAVMFSACLHSADSDEPVVEDLKDDSRVTVTKAEVDEGLKNLSVGLDVQYDDMKEVTYYRCKINQNIYPQMFLLPYVVVDNNYNVTLKNHILCVSTRNYEIIYFNKLYIKSNSGVESFELNEGNIVRSYAGEEYIEDMDYQIYKKLSESIEGNNVKIRLEGRLRAERDLTPDEIKQIKAVFTIYEYLSNIMVVDKK